MRRSNLTYAVEIALPERGVPGKLAMYDFHTHLGIVAHPVYGIHEKNGRRYVRWRFVNLTDAEKFARQFGGSIVAGR
jgi:hypothetical protein